MPAAIRDHIAGIIGDAFPAYTDRLMDWSLQIGSPVELPREQLESENAADGAQSPGEFQAILQNSGFDVWVHEWWEPGSAPPVARDPIATAALDGAKVLVNDVSSAQKKWRFQCGDGTQCEGTPFSVRCGMFDGYKFFAKQYPPPSSTDEYVHFFYVCDQTFPDPAYVPYEDFAELERLIYKYKPAQSRCILIAFMTIDEIQDSISETEILEDSISEPEILQDKAV